ncbi:Cytochrome P450 4B1 [Trichoplax sp. H2]|nr:Cytochrome P450 4B1 [Trichoplax sp. H2]|eukprot:RDD42232.1 Cytochrome P450 4B1 [Trichoplax sp. H2]
MATAETFLNFLNETSKVFDKYFVMWYGMTYPSFVCYHPDSVKTIINASPPKISIAYRFLNEWVGPGLLTENGKRWSRNRRLITPAFHFDVLKPYVRIYNEALDILTEKWSNPDRLHKPLDTFYDASLCTLDVITRCAFSVEFDCQRENVKHPYINAVRTITKLVTERPFNIFYHSDWIYSITSAGRKFYSNVQLTHEFTENVIRKRQGELSSSHDDGSKMKKHLDFLDVLLKATYENGEGLSLLEIRNEVDTFLFAGHDTSSSALSSTLYCIARYTEHQDKIRSEVDKILACKEEIEWKDLPELKYTSLCIKEAMRLYTTVPIIERTLERDVEIDGKILAAGSQIAIAGFMLHRNPDVWDDPEKYDPLRFLPENCGSRHPYAYIPFSAGSRNCIGQNFAINFLKVAVAKLVYRYYFTVDMKNNLTFTAPLVLKLHGHDIYIKERNN